jgi:hypothetical protein
MQNDRRLGIVGIFTYYKKQHGPNPEQHHLSQPQQAKLMPIMARMTGADTPPISISLPTLRLI